MMRGMFVYPAVTIRQQAKYRAENCDAVIFAAGTESNIAHPTTPTMNIDAIGIARACRQSENEVRRSMTTRATT